nr:immunoglobulin light chain junction region [Macaca mulatta]
DYYCGMWHSSASGLF